MLNVTDHYCISPAISKGGFPVIRVICHESVIYVTGHVSHRSEAQGLLPRITRQSETPVAKISHNGIVIILCPSKQSSPKARLRQHQ